MTLFIMLPTQVDFQAMWYSDQNHYVAWISPLIINTVVTQ